MAASEANPYAKTGGLADVIGSLPFSLKARGEDVAVALPLYRSAGPHMKTAERAFDCMRIALDGTIWECEIKRIVDRDVPFYFVDCPALFDRPALYGEAGSRLPR